VTLVKRIGFTGVSPAYLGIESMKPSLLAFYLISISIFLIAPRAFAAEGILEISQACAVQTGCFAGDPPGFPVTIATPGSYLLTSSVDSGAVRAIEIAAADVTLDLASLGVSGTSESPVIEATANGVVIRDGTVDGGGVALRDASSVVNVNVINFFQNGPGIRVGALGLVLNCVLHEEGGAKTSIVAGQGSLVLNNGTDSGDSVSASGSIIMGISTNSNDANMFATDRSMVIGNQLYGENLRLSTDSSYRFNQIYFQVSPEYISGGIDAGGNVCSDYGLLYWFPCP